jgi:hypothetical protein
MDDGSILISIIIVPEWLFNPSPVFVCTLSRLIKKESTLMIWWRVREWETQSRSRSLIRSTKHYTSCKLSYHRQPWINPYNIISVVFVFLCWFEFRSLCNANGDHAGLPDQCRAINIGIWAILVVDVLMA